MLFDVASSMFRCHTDLITSNGVPATQAKPPRIVIIEYLFPERSNHFFLPFDFHSFSTLSLYTYIYIYVYRRRFLWKFLNFQLGIARSSKFARWDLEGGGGRRRIAGRKRGIVAHFRCNGSQHREQFEPIAVSKLIRKRDTISFATKT